MFKDQSCTIDASENNFFYDKSRIDDSILCKTEISCFEEPPTQKRRCISTGPVWQPPSQSLMMAEMRERLSGYDYKLDV